ncbi:MAG: hypothetical protein AVDCRST_MAG24-1367, partial [uncultured Nocardioidaceae bacterium]
GVGAGGGDRRHRAGPDGRVRRPGGGRVRAPAGRVVVALGPAAGPGDALLHDDRPARRGVVADGRGRGQPGEPRRAADGLPQRLVLPARRRSGLAADPGIGVPAVPPQRGDARRAGARRGPERRRRVGRLPARVRAGRRDAGGSRVQARRGRL